MRTMPTRDVSELAELARDRELVDAESSSEHFDRIAFAARALSLLRPPRTHVALCEGRARVRVEAGRAWGGPSGERWAILSVPPTASRRAIAVAVATLAGRPAPYAFEVLLAPHAPHDMGSD
jgi:hypothetical protein